MMVKKEPNERLNDEHFLEVDAIVAEAKKAGVTHIINVGTSLQESCNAVDLALRYKTVSATLGIHPCDITETWQRELTFLESILLEDRDQKIVAIGETGLDYYHKPYDKVMQEEVFRAHIELAITHDKPLVVHIRDAGDDALAILSEYMPRGARGVVHCFSLDQEAADMLVSNSWLIGIDGPVTYKKNDALRAIAATVPLENILLETDAPFLTPQAFRGKRNTPGYLPLIAEQIALSRGVNVEEVARVTTQNAQRLFNLI